jgi:hypothetical protein
MRISKITLLANGLANEHEESIKENKISLAEHSKKLKEANINDFEQSKVEVSAADMKDTFKGIAQVNNTKGLLDSIKLPYIDYSESYNTKKDTSDIFSETSSEEDSFFDS